ncbi:uncharacterized protein LOC123549824 [Mercenaria mercenaria]|uniref:uncharacterized protein LOC123549824 n=1 Tax=Mercenaria mercenaria TaxID=6596 RepID=UPI00234F1E39|nr:uncharacterized protein LOC123549824 [Mercenaria mercenaria]XP_045194195.2 uncharacterized protein LOC123549824 [Mercenaria mercenaria]
MVAAFSVMSSNQMSILYQKSHDTLAEHPMFEAAYNELEINIPFFLRLMEAIIGNSGNKRATIVMIYSMILNSRNNKVSAIQRVITTLAVRCHADNMLLSRLNKLHITMSVVSKGNIITEWGDNYGKRLKKSIADGNDGKLNGDNVDIFVTTNDIRMTNRSKDYHFFATDFTPLKVTPEDFMKNEYLVTYLENERDPNITQEGLCQMQVYLKTILNFW